VLAEMNALLDLPTLVAKVVEEEEGASDMSYT
jgi:hypothetical protein